MDAQFLKRRVVGGFFWLAGTKLLGQAITWIITIVVVRLLSPQDYGLMGMAVLFTGFLLLFNEFGLGAAMVQHIDLDGRKVSDLRWAIFFVNLALFLLVLISAPLVAGYFSEPRLTTIVRVLSTSFIMNGVGAPSMFLLQREMAFRKKSQAEFVGSIAGGLSTLALAATGFGVWSLIGGYLLQQFATNALYCIHSPIVARLSFSFGNIRGLAMFGAQLAFAKVLWYAASNADFMVVGRVLGTTALGYYGLAFQLASVPIDKVSNLVTQVAFPAFSTLQNDDERLKRYFLTTVSAVAFVTFPMFLGLFLVADSVVVLFLTEKWLPVVFPLKVLCVISCSRAIDTINAPLIVAKGKPSIVVLNGVLQVIVLPLSFYVGAQYGLEGVSVAWLVAWPALACFKTWQALSLIGLTFPRYLGGLKHVIVSSIAMVLITTLAQRRVLVNLPETYQLAATCILGCVLYLGYHSWFNLGALREALGLVRGTMRGSGRAVPELNIDPSSA